MGLKNFGNKKCFDLNILDFVFLFLRLGILFFNSGILGIGDLEFWNFEILLNVIPNVKYKTTKK